MKRSPMPPRKKPMKRTGSLKRTGRIKPKKRTKAEAERIYGPDAFQAWMRAKPCDTCGRRGQIELAHSRTGGMGRKAGYETLNALCAPCHAEQHAVGIATFAENHGTTVQALRDRAAQHAHDFNAHRSA